MKSYFLLFLLIFTSLLNAQVSFIADKTEGCRPLTVHFTNTSTIGDHYEWEVGGITYTDSVDFSITLTNPRYYNVILYAKDLSDNTIGTASSSVIVSGVSGDLWGDDLYCINEIVEFNRPSSSFSSKTSYWSLGNGDISTDIDLEYQYLSPGIYSLSYIENNSCGTDTVSKTITISDDLPISGNFSYYSSYDSVCTGHRINFSSNSNFYSHSWQFQDTVISRYSFYRDFKTTGITPYTLTFSNGCGNDTTFYDTIFVSDDLNYFTYFYTEKKAQICPGDKVDFWLQNNTGEKTIWDFKYDSVIATNYSSFSRSFNTVGIHPFEVKTYNYCNNYESVFDTIFVQPDIPIPDDINVYVPDRICPNSIFDLYASTSYYPQELSCLWEFDDGGISNLQYFLYAYTTIGEHPYTLTVSNNCGSDSTIYDTIQVLDDLKVTVNNVDISDSGYPGEAINIDIDDTGFNTYEIYINDELISNYDDYDFAYKIIDPGTYEVKITISNTCQNSDTTIIDEYICLADSNNTLHYIYYYILSSSACINTPIYFDIIDYNYKLIEWDMGNGKKIYGNDFYYSYPDTGNYTVIITAYGYNGKSVQDSIFIEIRNDIKSDLQNLYISPHLSYLKEVCPGDNITYISTYNNNIKSILWEFSDGTTSTLCNVEKKSPNEEGVYTTKLTVENMCGLTSTDSISIRVVNDLPIEDINTELNSITACTWESISFGSISDNDIISSLSWDFGDGTQSNELSPSHYYSTEGTYNVKMTAINSCGNEKEIISPVIINNYGTNFNDDVYFEMLWSDVCPGDPIAFISYADKEYDYEIWDGSLFQKIDSWSYNWEGPEIYQRMEIFEYAFSDTGMQQVKVRITDNCGNEKITSRSVQISNYTNKDMNSEMIMAKYNYCLYEKVSLFAWGGHEVKWNFGDNSPIITENKNLSIVDHYYHEKGFYTITSIVSNSCGDIDTFKYVIEIGDECGFLPQSIEEEKQQSGYGNSDFLVYPNPTGSTLNIAGDFSGDIIELSIVNLMGQEIYKEIHSSSEIINTNVSQLSSGMYIIIVKDEKRKNSKIFIKE